MGTRLAVIGDVHAKMAILGRVLAHIAKTKCDGVLLVGDIGVDVFGDEARHRQSVRRVLDTVGGLGIPVAYVPGNHDLPEQTLPGNVDGRSLTIGGLVVAGIGGAGPQRFGFPYEWDEHDIRARAVPGCDVLLCHTPPARTPLDRVMSGTHVGSEAIRERAEGHRGFLVCGHIHEAPSAVQLGDCLCMNVGGLGAPYGRAQVGYIERSDGGDTAWHVDLETEATQRWSRT